MFGKDGKPLQYGFRPLPGRLMQLVDQQLGYHVQAGHKITQAVRVIRK
jgi:hypothetical protein